MKIFNIKAVVTLLSFSFGISGIWASGSSSNLINLFEQTSSVSETTPQIIEVPTPSNSVKSENIFVLQPKPRFEEYPITEIYKGKVAPLKLTRKERESVFGEKLQYTIDNYPKVDFAGHYIVANWSCGMWCQWNAIIDAKNGKVYQSPVSTEVCLPHLDNEFVCDENFSSIEYRIDSKLIIFFGFRYDNNPDGEKGFHFYKFESGRFIHLKSILIKEQRSARQIQLDEFDEENK